MSLSMRELGFAAMPHLAQRRAVYGPFGNGLGRHTTWGPNPCFTGCGKPAQCPPTIINIRCGCPGPCGAHGTGRTPPPPPVYDTPVYDPPYDTPTWVPPQITETPRYVPPVVTETPHYDPPSVTHTPWAPPTLTQTPFAMPGQTVSRVALPMNVPPSVVMPAAAVGDTVVVMPQSQAAAARPVPGITSSTPIAPRATVRPLGTGVVSQGFQPMQTRRSYVPGGEVYSGAVSGLGAGGQMSRNGNGTPFAYANPGEFANVGKPRPTNGGTFTLDELAAAGFVIGSPYEPSAGYGGPSAVAFQRAKPNQGGAKGSSLSMDELAAAGFDVGPAYDPSRRYGGPSAVAFQRAKPNDGGAQGSNLGNERVNEAAMILRDFGGVPPGPFQTEVARAPVYRADGVVLEPLALTGERF